MAARRSNRTMRPAPSVHSNNRLMPAPIVVQQNLGADGRLVELGLCLAAGFAAGFARWLLLAGAGCGRAVAGRSLLWRCTALLGRRRLLAHCGFARRLGGLLRRQIWLEAR